MFHLLQSVSLHTICMGVGVPARGLHREAYRGHVFWDELFVLPFLSLSMRFPEVVRALLMYRWRRLPAARRAARDVGRAGAMYPWQSGSDGTLAVGGGRVTMLRPGRTLWFGLGRGTDGLGPEGPKVSRPTVDDPSP